MLPIVLFATSLLAQAGGPAEAQVETLKTRDGVTLKADYYPASPGAPGVVLLHMIPPHWERSSWPTEFIGALHKRGWSVINIDRRGAGESGGVAKEAYEGENGRYDVEAAVKRLQQEVKELQQAREALEDRLRKLEALGVEGKGSR